MLIQGTDDMNMLQGTSGDDSLTGLQGNKSVSNLNQLEPVVDNTPAVDEESTLESDGIITGKNLVVDENGVIGSINLSTGEFIEIFDTELPLTDVDVAPNGDVFGISFDDLYKIDLEENSVALVGSHGATGLNALEISGDDILFGTSNIDRELYTLDPSTGVAFSIGTIPFNFTSAGDLQFVESTLYLSDEQSLISLDVNGNTLNSAEIIGSFGLSNEGIFGITIDDDGDTVGLTDLGAIVEINLNTGAATPIGTVEDNLGIFGAAAISDSLLSEEDLEPSSTPETVYRFLNNNTGVHFYTADEAEKAATEQSSNFTFEGAAYNSVDPVNGEPAPQPVYRFLNLDTDVYLYTISENEREFIQNELDNFVFEGEAFYGYQTEVEGSIPIYRFINANNGAHFYTPSETERDSVEANFPNFQYEGIAYFALPLDEDASIDGFTGATIQYQGFSPNLNFPITEPATAIVGDGLEFGNIPSFSNTSSNVLDLNIDISATSILFEVDQSAPTISSLGGEFNGEVLTDINNEIPSIENVTIDESVNSFGLESENISFTEDSISVNLAGLRFSPGLNVLLDVEFAGDGI